MIADSGLKVFYETVGLYSDSARVKAEDFARQGFKPPSNVVINTPEYISLVKLVGVENFRSMFSLLLDEKLSGLDPIVLVDFFLLLSNEDIGFSAFSNVVTYMSELDGRLNAFNLFLNNERSKGVVIQLKDTQKYMRAYSELLRMVCIFVNNLFKELSGHYGSFFTHLCHCSIGLYSESFVVLNFFERQTDQSIITKLMRTDIMPVVQILSTGNGDAINRFLDCIQLQKERAAALACSNLINRVSTY